MANPLYVPLNVDIGDTSGKLTVPWRQFFQALNGTMGPVATAITQLTGDVTAGPGPGSVAATIANDAVTYAKMQNVSAASRLLGRGSAAGAGNVEEITPGTGLTMSGTTLNATVGTVTNTGTLTDHAVIVGNGGVDVSALASLGTTTTVLHGNASGDPTFGAVSLTADVSGILPVANGGSGVATGAALQVATKTLINAEIKSLPGTAITLIAAPASGFQNRVIASTIIAYTANGAYTGIDTTYATLQIETAGGVWVQTVIANDSSYTTPLARLTAFLGATNRLANLGIYLEAIQSGGGSGDWGYLEPTVGSAITDFEANLVRLKMDNNGNTADLGGGHASNTLKVTVYYVVEAV